MIPIVLDLIAILAFALHLLAMNAASAGPLASLVFDWRQRDRADSHAAACYLAGVSIMTYLAGMVLGLALAALVWNGETLRTILSLLEHKIYYGVWELVFSLVLLLGHYAWLRNASLTSAAWARAVRTLIVLLAASNLLYHFPPLFAVAARITDGWHPGVETISPALFREQLMHPQVASQSIHFVLASIAAAGVMVLGVSMRMRKAPNADEASAARVARIGGWTALVPTLSQVIVGMWVLLALPSAVQKSLMGGDLLLSGLFLLSLAAALGLMHALASIAMGDSERKLIGRAMGLFGTTVVLMSAVLYLV